MAKKETAELNDILERVRSDRSNLIGARTGEEQIRNLEERLGITFPKNYVAFLKEFDGGQFNFARMHCITESGAGWHDFVIELERFFSNAPLMGVRSLLPFGSSYAGDVFCFDMAAATEDDAPILMYDHEGSDDQELNKEASSLLTWIRDYYEDLDNDPFSVELYLASDANLEEIKDKCKGEAFQFTTFGDDEYPVRIYLAGRREFKYQISMSEDDWKGTRSKDVASDKEALNAKHLKRLGEMIQALAEKTKEPLELFVFSSGEMSSMQQFKTLVGTIKMFGKDMELNAGDHFEIDEKGNISKIARAELENHVTRPVKSTELSCSFCSLGQSDVKKLIAGPSCFICDQCVGLCADIVAEEVIEEN